MAEGTPRETPTQLVKDTKIVKSTLKWAANGGIQNPTPKWALNIFRTEFVLNKVLVFVLGASTLFTPTQVKESLVWIAAGDLLTWLFAKQFGIKKEDFEN